MLTPLDSGEVFHLSLSNPNPRSAKSKEGPVYRISFEVSQEDFLMFMDANTQGMVLEAECYAVLGTGTTEPRPQPRKGPYGDLAHELRQSGVLASDRFMEHIGPDSDYHAWVQRQPSCISGDFGEYLADGVHASEGRNEAAHVRRAGAAGTSYKPKYTQVPLTHEEHAFQHQHGEVALLAKHGIVNLITDDHPFIHAQEWFDKQVFKHRHEWAWQTLKLKLGHASWSDVPPKSLVAWCQKRGIAHLLPACYREHG